MRNPIRFVFLKNGPLKIRKCGLERRLKPATTGQRTATEHRGYKEDGFGASQKRRYESGAMLITTDKQAGRLFNMALDKRARRPFYLKREL